MDGISAKSGALRAFGLLFGLLLLRVVIGFHFFHEGHTKIRSGDFDAAPFLWQACGPLKGFYHGLVDDFDGRIRLSVDPVDPFVPQADRTIALWDQYGQSAAEKWSLDEEGRKAIDAVIQKNSEHLQALLETDRTRIISWLRGESRLEGFARDEQLSAAAASEVASLAGQVGTIAGERRAESQGWFSIIEAMWDDVESSVNDVGRRHGKSTISLNRPFAEKWSPNGLINLALPWFDLGVGALLVVGLFTRFAAFAGAALLLGVVGSQPFWLPMAQPTWSQWIELAALLVVAFSPAGRFGGLDYFFSQASRTRNSEQQ
jgi:uncharacterized membrane protein YphA (DoxX/SURF4 family)